MQWSRSNSIGLAQASCTHCQGLGMRLVRNGKGSALRLRISCGFSHLFQPFRQFAWKGNTPARFLWNLRRPRWPAVPIRASGRYMADFAWLAAGCWTITNTDFPNSLSAGADWRLCCASCSWIAAALSFHLPHRAETGTGLSRTRAVRACTAERILWRPDP